MNIARLENMTDEEYLVNGNKNQIQPSIKQAEAELGQAQLNWKLGFAEVGAEFGNKSSSFCGYDVYSSGRLTLIY